MRPGLTCAIIIFVSRPTNRRGDYAVDECALESRRSRCHLVVRHSGFALANTPSNGATTKYGPWSSAMWEHAEVVGLLDREGCVRVVSRNEAEAFIHHVVGRNIREMLAPGSHQTFEAAFQAALAGDKGASLTGRRR